MVTASRKQATQDREHSSPAAGSRLGSRLFEPVDVAVFAYFRVLFGGCLLWHFGRRLAGDWIAHRYVDPGFHFQWLGLEWIGRWPGQLMTVHVAAVALLSLFVMLGFFYRLSATLLFAAIVYMLLLDKAYYHDFDYLICLLSGLLIFLPAQRAFSLDGVLSKDDRRVTAPAWMFWLLRAQIAVPYVFGGLAKLNGDWLSGEPLRTRLAEAGFAPLLGSAFRGEWMIYVVSYASLLFGLTVVPLLLFRRTRIWAFAAAVVLNCAYTFDGWTYAFFMILSTLVFFPPDWPRSLFGRGRSTTSPLGASLPDPERLTSRRKRTVALLAVYLAIQVLVPLRHCLYPSDPSWTNEGHRFAWRSTVRHLRSVVRFDAIDPNRNFSQKFEPQQLRQAGFLNAAQIQAMSADPDMILDFAHFLRDLLRQKGLEDVEIRATALASLNGREPQYLVNADVDLAAQPRHWLKPYWWITPLGEPLHKFNEEF